MKMKRRRMCDYGKKDVRQLGAVHAETRRRTPDEKEAEDT